jgi:hypothetical protein
MPRSKLTNLTSIHDLLHKNLFWHFSSILIKFLMNDI